MVQLHLFVVESQAKGHGAQCVPARTQSHNSPQEEAQAHSIVPDYVKVVKCENLQVIYVELILFLHSLNNMNLNVFTVSF